MFKLKKLSIIIGLKILFTSVSSSAFILIDRNYTLSSPEAVVNIAADTCPTVSVTNESLRMIIQSALDDFWNTVSESTLRLKVGSVVSRTTYNELVNGEILLGCSPSTLGNGGVTSINVTKGSAFILLDSQIAAAGTDRIAGVVIHELGHAVGLTHSSDPASVMTYESQGWGLRPKYLSQDDKNGVIYLYPQEGKFLGLIPGCSANAFQQPDSKLFSQNKSFLAFLQECLFYLISFLILRKWIGLMTYRYRPNKIGSERRT